jgi:hypothetical protein
MRLREATRHVDVLGEHHANGKRMRLHCLEECPHHLLVALDVRGVSLFPFHFAGQPKCLLAGQQGGVDGG